MKKELLTFMHSTKLTVFHIQVYLIDGYNSLVKASQKRKESLIMVIKKPVLAPVVRMRSTSVMVREHFLMQKNKMQT